MIAEFGTQQELQLLALLVSAAVLLILAGPLRIPYPILLVLGGLMLGFVPGVPKVTMPPEVVLIGILPPLLYVSAFRTGLRELRQNLRPISLLAKVPSLYVVNSDVPAKNLKEFIALAKRRPGEITYGSAGNGSYVHLSMALLASMAKVDMVHVPYKGGGPVNVAIASGEIQAVLATIGSLTANLNAKRVRPLGVSSEKRTAAYPNVPAIAEFVPGYEFTAWVGCFAPAGTPKAVIDRLNALIGKALADRDVAAKLSAQTLDPMHMTPAQFAQRLKSDYDKYANVIKLSGAKID